MKWYLLSFLLLITTGIRSQKTDFEKALEFRLKQDFKSALPLLEKEIEKGNADAMYCLGEFYHKGLGVAKDEKLAFNWYLRSAQKGNAYSMNIIGRFYTEGWNNIEKDSIRAVFWTKKSADAECPAGQFNYAFMLYHGKYVEKNYHKARLLFEKALAGKELLASLYLGYIYYYGYDIDKDYNKALTYFLLNEKNPDNSFMLGECFRLGRGADIDREKSLAFYETAAKDNKNAKALRILGDLYYIGNFTPQDKVKARSYYERGLILQPSIFQERLDLLYPDFSSFNETELYESATCYYASNRTLKYYPDNNNYIVVIDTVYMNEEFYKTALELAVSKKYTPAIITKIQNLYHGKENYKIDKKEAIKLALPLAKEDLSVAILIAEYYTENHDVKNTFKYYDIAATVHNSKEAKKILTQFYENGIGTKQDIWKALRYYREIEDHASASELCKFYGIKDEIEYGVVLDNAFSTKNYTELFDLSKEGAAKGYDYCLLMQAFCFLYGYHVDVNVDEAIKILESIKDKDEFYQIVLAWAYQARKREKDAFLVYESLVEKDYAGAYSYLSDCYINGTGTFQDIQKGIHVLEQGIEKHNDAMCLNTLAFLQQYGIGTEKNLKEAVKNYEKAGKVSFYSNGKINIASCYLNGIGVEEDKAKAIRLMENEIKNENTVAFRYLGECYLLGNGVNANYSKAVAYFEKSKDNYISKLFLAICYELGLGVERNIQKSRLLLREIDNRFLRIFTSDDTVTYEYLSVPGFVTKKITVKTNENNGLLQRYLTVYYPDNEQTINPLLSAIPVVSSNPSIAQPKNQAAGQTPEIIIMNYEDGDIFSDNDIELIYRFFPSNQELTKIDVKINGESMSNHRGFSKQGELSLSLPNKDSRVDLTPYNQYGKGNTTTIYLKWEPKQDIRPNLHVLAIGVGDYKFYPKLKYPIKDMDAFTDITREKSKSLYKSVNVQKLSNEEASIRNIKRELSRLIQKAQEEDFIFIYYAGHGDVHDDQYYFIPIDGEKDDIRSTCLKSSDFMDDVNSIKGKVVLFVDACYSGNLISARSPSPQDIYDALYALRKVEKDVYIFTSSAGRTKSVESEEWEGGLFTKVLLDAFRGKARRNNENILTTEALRQYLIEEMKKLYKDQSPRFSAMPDFPLLVY